MSTATAVATYTQLRDGSWGIRVAGTTKEGATIAVRKKSGEEKQEVVSKILWTGRDKTSKQTISLCSIEGSAAPSQRRPFSDGDREFRGRSSRSRSQYGCRNGQCYCPHCTSGSECLCNCSCGFGG